MSRFAPWWCDRFGDLPPLGFCLREALPDRWLRLHSLPQSKRYAQTPLEHAEVRQRGWACAAELLASTDGAWVVTCSFEEPTLAVLLPEAPSLKFEPALSFPSVGDLLAGTAHAADVNWPHDGFDSLIDAIADDRHRVLWASRTTGEVFAPYDGGIDLILESSPRRDSLRRLFSEWLSSHPSGL